MKHDFRFQRTLRIQDLQFFMHAQIADRTYLNVISAEGKIDEDSLCVVFRGGPQSRVVSEVDEGKKGLPIKARTGSFRKNREDQHTRAGLGEVRGQRLSQIPGSRRWITS